MIGASMKQKAFCQALWWWERGRARWPHCVESSSL